MLSTQFDLQELENMTGIVENYTIVRTYSKGLDGILTQKFQINKKFDGYDPLGVLILINDIVCFISNKSLFLFIGISIFACLVQNYREDPFYF